MNAHLATMLREQDCEPVIVNGVEDHVHALFALSRTHSIASVVKEGKRTSALSFCRARRYILEVVGIAVLSRQAVPAGERPNGRPRAM
jgi:REP element-mobilizing transposase RayT